MDTTSTIGLTDSTVYPDERVLQSVLGKSYNAYRRLLKLYDDHEMEYGWRYYKDGRAWLCKVRKKKRTIVWMSAWKGYVKATIYFPEKYIDEIYRLDIGEETIHRIKNTKNTGKSKPCIFEIRNTAILKDIGKVIEFKIAAK